MGGVPGKPTYLTVQACNSTATSTAGQAQTRAVTLSFRAEHHAGLTRDLAVLTDGAAPPKTPKCMDADGMSAHLQLYDCIAGDDDQQYATSTSF